MLTAIEGIYENGHIVLDEQLTVQKRTKVVVTFLEEEIQPSHRSGTVKLGSLKGKLTVPDNFNDPLDDLKDYMY